ncbi:hypothetical protein HZH68_010716 [Vespula germanica]|uniref:Uncharacterized protein n=1 Tax=Vespula germanica TaxID=30212 RepID=A0A834JUL9_VESGE|nr:hypothetical protein HZH68_010716 [Vespula germanica]
MKNDYCGVRTVISESGIEKGFTFSTAGDNMIEQIKVFPSAIGREISGNRTRQLEASQRTIEDDDDDDDDENVSRYIDDSKWRLWDVIGIPNLDGRVERDERREFLGRRTKCTSMRGVVVLVDGNGDGCGGSSSVDGDGGGDADEVEAEAVAEIAVATDRIGSDRIGSDRIGSGL